MDSTEASDGKRKALTTMCDSGKRLTSLEGRGSCYIGGGATTLRSLQRDFQGEFTWERGDRDSYNCEIFELPNNRIYLYLNYANTSWLGSPDVTCIMFNTLP